MINRSELEAEIRAAAAAAAEVKDYLEKFAEQVRDYWRSVSPVDEGKYAASVQVFKKNLMIDGMPAKRVGAKDFKAHWIEFGTSDPAPTPAFAPRAKTAAHFGGDEKRIYAQDIEVDQ
jgi:hypothetical protein